MNINSKPLIGIVCDDRQGAYNTYQLRCKYIEYIEQCGGIPVLLTYNKISINYWIEQITGLIIPGSSFHIPPNWYGEEDDPNLAIKEYRFKVEYQYLAKMLEYNRPILGICGGHQLINVFFGGTLIKNLTNESDILQHWELNPNVEQHNITINKNSFLYDLLGIESFKTNTSHMQSVAKLGNGLVVNAVADDGIIEAIHHKDYDFCLGVQFHPEYHINNFHQQLGEKFIHYCKQVVIK